jgi:hypothetical protein
MGKRSVLLVIIAFCLPVLLYLQTIHFGLTHFDDNDIISSNIKFLANFKNAPQSFLTDAFVVKISPFYRPLETLSYMIDIKLSGGNNTWMYHLGNILLAGFISSFLFLLLRRFSTSSLLALTGALIYCAHPLFVSTIAYIPNRCELQLVFFSLLSFIFFMDFLEKKKKIYLLLHWVAFAMALFSKETAIMLPFLFISYYLIYYPAKHFEKEHLFIIILYAVSGILWMWLRSVAIGDYSTPAGTFGLMPFLSNLRVVPESLTKLFLPFDFAPIPSFTLWKTAAGVGIMIIIIILFFRNNERPKKEKIFCFAWFLILMIPPMMFKHPYIDYLDHRFFLPLIGMLLFTLFLFPMKWAEKRNSKKYWPMIAVLLLLCSFTFIKSRSYSDPTTFYNSAVSQNPNSALAYNNRGYLKFTHNDFQGAVDDYSKAIAICCTYDGAFNNRGFAKLNLGEKQEAIADFNSAIALNNKNAEAYCNRGAAYMSMGNYDLALSDYDKSIALSPGYAEAYNNKGVAMNSTGKYTEAVKYLNKAIEIDPNHLSAYGNRSISKYHLKDFAGALEDCEMVLKLNPNDKRALNLKAKAQQELQQESH